MPNSAHAILDGYAREPVATSEVATGIRIRVRLANSGHRCGAFESLAQLACAQLLPDAVDLGARDGFQPLRQGEIDRRTRRNR